MTGITVKARGWSAPEVRAEVSPDGLTLRLDDADHPELWMFVRITVAELERLAKLCRTPPGVYIHLRPYDPLPPAGTDEADYPDGGLK